MSAALISTDAVFSFPLQINMYSWIGRFSEAGLLEWMQGQAKVKGVNNPAWIAQWECERGKNIFLLVIF